MFEVVYHGFHGILLWEKKMDSRNDKGWKIHFEKRADDEFLFHVKGIRKIVSILILLTVFTIIYLIDGYFRFHS